MKMYIINGHNMIARNLLSIRQRSIKPIYPTDSLAIKADKEGSNFPERSTCDFISVKHTVKPS